MLIHVTVKPCMVNTSSKYHPVYGGNVDLVYNREEDTRIEGGDELVLLKMSWQLVSHNVQMLHQLKNCW